MNNPDILKLFGIEQEETQETPIPFAPNTSPEEVDDIVADSQQKIQNEVDNRTTGFNLAQQEAMEHDEPEVMESQIPQLQPQTLPTQPKSKEENILEMFKKLQADREASIAKARDVDERNAMYDGLMGGASKIANAFANRGGYTDIKNTPASIKTDLENKAISDSARPIQDLLQEYNIKRQQQSDLSASEKAKIDQKHKDDLLKLERDKLAARERMTDKKILESQNKEQNKENRQIAKEDRKLKQDMEKSLTAVDDQIRNVEDALKALDNMSGLADTGPLDQYVAKFTPSGQKLETALNKLALDKMVSMFQGMSKAVDSDAERKFFQSAQANLGNYSDVNRNLLKDAKKHLENLKAKTQNALKEKGGSFESSNTPAVGSIINAKGKRYRVIDESGNLEEVK